MVPPGWTRLQNIRFDVDFRICCEEIALTRIVRGYLQDDARICSSLVDGLGARWTMDGMNGEKGVVKSGKERKKSIVQKYGNRRRKGCLTDSAKAKKCTIMQIHFIELKGA